MIFLTENIPYTPKMLADELDFEESTVQLALEALQRFNMIVADSGYFAIAGWEEYQNIEGMERIREQTRLRNIEYRKRKKQELISQGDVSVTSHDATDKEEDKEIDKEYISIVSYLNEKAGTNFKATTGKTKSAINARLNEGFKLEDFKTVIDKKCAEWIGTEMQKYLRPETLFGTKFEGYLNAKQGRNDTHAGTESDFHSARKYGNYI
jgi:uncharacterized phage protein (TIGR02220 family)